MNTPKTTLTTSVKFWHQTHRYDLIANSFGMSSGALYPTPIKISAIARYSQPRFKLEYSGTGVAWSFNFFVALYRVMNGRTGATATLQKVREYGAASRNVATDPATDTIYNLDAVSSVINDHIPADGVYCIAFVFVDTSAGGSSVTANLFGTTLPSFAGWFHRGDGSGHSSPPQTINAFTGETTFKIYAELA